MLVLLLVGAVLAVLKSYSADTFCIHSCICRRKSTGAALGDLSSLADALGAAEGEVLRREQKTRKGLGVGGAKARRLITSKETVRLQQVHIHGLQVLCRTPESLGNTILQKGRDDLFCLVEGNNEAWVVAVGDV